MSVSSPIGRRHFITVYTTDAERPLSALGFPRGQFVYSEDTRQLRVCSGSAVWPAPVGGGGNDGTLKLARLCSLAPLVLAGAIALIDGVAPAAGNVIAALGQAGDAGNGLYVYNPAGAWPRAADFNDSDEVKTGALIVIEEGATNKSLVFELTTPDSAIPSGPTPPLLPLAFEEVAGPFSATAQSVSAANSGGTSELMSRGDHSHKGVQSIGAGDASIVIAGAAPSFTAAVQEDPAGAIVTTAAGVAVQVNADGSISLAGNKVGVGVLATDTQHGVRGGSNFQHPDVTPNPGGVSGFQTAADKLRQDQTQGGFDLLVGGVAIVTPPTKFDPAGGINCNRSGPPGATTSVTLQIVAVDPGGANFTVNSLDAAGVLVAEGTPFHWSTTAS